jgi:hypothetical protein
MSGRHAIPPPPDRPPTMELPSTVGGNVEYFCVQCGTYVILTHPLTTPRKMVHKHHRSGFKYYCDRWAIVEELQFGEKK